MMANNPRLAETYWSISASLMGGSERQAPT